MGPYFSMACIVYTEQVGSNTQARGSSGLMKSLYIFIGKMTIFFIMREKSF